MGTIEDTATLAGKATFRHEALLYAGEDAFLEGAHVFDRPEHERRVQVVQLPCGVYGHPWKPDHRDEPCLEIHHVRACDRRSSGPRAPVSAVAR